MFLLTSGDFPGFFHIEIHWQNGFYQGVLNLRHEPTLHSVADDGRPVCRDSWPARSAPFRISAAVVSPKDGCCFTMPVTFCGIRPRCPACRPGPGLHSGLRPVGIEDVQKVQIPPLNLGGKASQNPGADGVAADVQDAGPAPVLKHGQNCRVDGGNVRPPPQGGDDDPDAGGLQPLGLLLGTEIGVDNVQIGQDGFCPPLPAGEPGLRRTRFFRCRSGR